MAQQESIVEEQISQPGEVPQTQMIAGFLAESSQPDHQRVLLDPTGNQYLEIPTADIVSTRSLDTGQTATGLGGSAVFVNQNAHVLRCTVQPMSVLDFVRSGGGAASSRFFPALAPLLSVAAPLAMPAIEDALSGLFRSAPSAGAGRGFYPIPGLPIQAPSVMDIIGI